MSSSTSDINNNPPVSEPPEQKPLTLRQEEILRHLSNGLSYRDVASQLSISETTVKYHMQEIRKRLRLKNRTHAIAYFLTSGQINGK